MAEPLFGLVILGWKKQLDRRERLRKSGSRGPARAFWREPNSLGNLWRRIYSNERE